MVDPDEASLHSDMLEGNGKRCWDRGVDVKICEKAWKGCWDRSEEKKHKDSKRVFEIVVRSASYGLSQGRVSRGFRLDIPDEYGRPGQILRVKLQNFMCHENFEIYLSKNVNFIAGQNGSGKSAIVQAIQICLGVRARETGRGSTITQFVKNGCNTACVQVSIWNTGSCPFQFEKYGKVITVERKLGRSTSYALLNEQGVQMAGSKESLDELSNYFQICCSNPIVVLTQDIARSFLSGSRLESKLYSLYMKATQFEDHVANMQIAKERIRVQKENFDSHQEHVQNMEETIKDLDLRIETLQEAEEISQGIQHLRYIFPYLQVEEWERMLVGRVQNVESVLKPDLVEFEAMLEVRQREAREAKERQSTANKKLDDLRETIKKISLEIEPYKQEKKKLSHIKGQKMQECRRKERDIDGLKREKEDFLQEISHIQGDARKNTEEVRAAFNAKCTQLGKEVDEVKAAAFREQETLNEMEAALDTKREELSQCREAERHFRDQLVSNEGRARSLQNSIGDPLLKFGGHAVKNLWHRIQANKARFHALPLGPIGSLLTLGNDNWGAAIEYAIGRFFEAFIVTDRHDERLVKELAQQIGPEVKKNLQLFVYDFRNQAYDLRGIDSHNVLTILKVLRFADCENQHVVQNVLIDYANIETSGLTEQERDAWGIVKGRLGNEGRISQVWLPNGRRVYRKGGNANSVHDGRNVTVRLVKDVSQQIEQLQQQRQEMSNQLAQVQNSKVQLEREYQEGRRALDAAKSKKKELERSQYVLESQFDELQASGPVQESQGEGAIKELEQRVATLDWNIRECEKELQSCTAELDETSQKLDEVVEVLRGKGASAASFRQEVSNAGNEIMCMGSEIQRTETEAQKCMQTIQEKRRDMEKAQGDNEQIKELIMNGTAAAEEACSQEEYEKSKKWFYEELRISHPNATDAEIQAQSTADRIKERIEQLEKKEQDYKRRGGGYLDQLVEEKDVLHRKWTFEHATLGIVQHENRTFEKGYNKRVHSYESVLWKTDKLVTMIFKDMMKLRGHVGSLRLDHDEEQLFLRVQMQGQDTSVKDMKSLSGGERSYTMVAFVLALAEIIESPFYCMDEFDVFMDAVNRRMVMEALLLAAHEARNRSQFLFFTPQDIAVLDDAKEGAAAKLAKKPSPEALCKDFIKVFRLNAPRQQQQ